MTTVRTTRDGVTCPQCRERLDAMPKDANGWADARDHYDVGNPAGAGMGHAMYFVRTGRVALCHADKEVCPAEWHNCGVERFLSSVEPNAEQVVLVTDGVEPYCRALRLGETARDACREFAAGYDGAGDGVDCDATTFERGEDVSWLRFRFSTGSPVEFR